MNGYWINRADESQFVDFSGDFPIVSTWVNRVEGGWLPRDGRVVFKTRSEAMSAAEREIDIPGSIDGSWICGPLTA